MSKVTADEAREQIRPLYLELAKAVGAEKDYSFLDRHLDPTWIYVDFVGVRRGPAEYRRLVDEIASYSMDMRSFDVRMVRDDLAMITGVYHSRGELKSGWKTENTIIFSSIWELRDGVWKWLLHHTTKVQD